MDKPAEKRQFAWQPLTARGVAAFAGASAGRLWLVQLIVGCLAALSVVWFLRTAWAPVVLQAIGQLPVQSEIRHAKLTWGGSSPESLAENRFLSISIDLKHEGRARSPAHIQAELGESTVKVLSLLGFTEVAYPDGWRIGLGRAQAGPWWGAWRPALLAMAAGATVLALMAIWAILGLLYSGPAWLLAFFANREIRWASAWRLVGAALLPGALFLSVAIVFYGLGLLDLLLFGGAVAVHLLIGWVYVAAAVFYLPIRKEDAPPKVNPFAAGADAKKATE